MVKVVAGDEDPVGSVDRGISERCLHCGIQLLVHLGSVFDTEFGYNVHLHVLPLEASRQGLTALTFPNKPHAYACGSSEIPSARVGVRKANVLGGGVFGDAFGAAFAAET
jgi:hypothetical protein